MNRRTLLSRLIATITVIVSSPLAKLSSVGAVQTNGKREILVSEEVSAQHFLRYADTAGPIDAYNRFYLLDDQWADLVTHTEQCGHVHLVVAEGWCPQRFAIHHFASDCIKDLGQCPLTYSETEMSLFLDQANFRIARLRDQIIKINGIPTWKKA